MKVIGEKGIISAASLRVKAISNGKPLQYRGLSRTVFPCKISYRAIKGNFFYTFQGLNTVQIAVFLNTAPVNINFLTKRESMGSVPFIKIRFIIKYIVPE